MNILINWISTINYLVNFSGILFPLKLDRNRIYTAPKAQGLKLHVCHAGARMYMYATRPNTQVSPFELDMLELLPKFI